MGMTASTDQGPPDLHLIEPIEIAMGHNLQDFVSTLQHVAPRAGAEWIDVAGGVAAFTGVGSPLTTVKGAHAPLGPRDLDEIESFFGDHREATVTIELAPWLDDETRQLLHTRGYREAGREDVVATTSGTSPPGGTHRVAHLPLHDWPDLVRRTSELPDEPALRDLAEAAAHLRNAQLYGVRSDDRWIACAQSVAYGDFVIFGCDGTLPTSRHRGAQTALIHGRLDALPPGKHVTAEVEPGSGSERNYRRAGFRIAYTRTTYARALGR
jgi:hypothetical protein